MDDLKSELELVGGKNFCYYRLVVFIEIWNQSTDRMYFKIIYLYLHKIPRV